MHGYPVNCSPVLRAYFCFPSIAHVSMDLLGSFAKRQKVKRNKSGESERATGQPSLEATLCNNIILSSPFQIDKMPKWHLELNKPRTN